MFVWRKSTKYIGMQSHFTSGSTNKWTREVFSYLRFLQIDFSPIKWTTLMCKKRQIARWSWSLNFPKNRKPSQVQCHGFICPPRSAVPWAEFHFNIYSTGVKHSVAVWALNCKVHKYGKYGIETWGRIWPRYISAAIGFHAEKVKIGHAGGYCFAP